VRVADASRARSSPHTSFSNLFRGPPWPESLGGGGGVDGCPQPPQSSSLSRVCARDSDERYQGLLLSLFAHVAAASRPSRCVRLARSLWQGLGRPLDVKRRRVICGANKGPIRTSATKTVPAAPAGALLTPRWPRRRGQIPRRPTVLSDGGRATLVRPLPPGDGQKRRKCQGEEGPRERQRRRRRKVHKTSFLSHPLRCTQSKGSIMLMRIFSAAAGGIPPPSTFLPSI